MKIINKTLLFVALSLLSFACGEEEKPVPVQRKVTEKYVFSVPITGNKGQTITENKLPPIRLADIIGEEAAKNIIRADIQTADSYLEVKGLKQLEGTPELEDFTLQIEGREPKVNFGKCTPNSDLATDFKSDQRQSTKIVSQFIEDLLDAYTHNGDRSARVILSFAPTATILPANKVNLEITITADYIYNTFR